MPRSEDDQRPTCAEDSTTDHATASTGRWRSPLVLRNSTTLDTGVTILHLSVDRA